MHEVAAAPGGSPARRYRVVTSRGTWHARHVVIATGPHGTPHVPAGLAGLDTARVDLVTSNNYRNPGRLADGRRPRRGRLGVRHADRRRAQPGRPRGHPRGRPTHPDAQAAPRPRHLLVAREHRPPGPDHRRGGRPGGRARGDLAAARRPRRPASGPPRTSTSAASRSAASASSDGSTRSTAARLGFRDDLAATVGDADATLDRLLDSLDHFVERIGLAGQLWDGPRPRPVAIGPRGAGSTCAPRASARCWSHPATAPHHPWLRLPITDPDGTIRQHRGVTPRRGCLRRRAALPAPARLGPDRRGPARRRGGGGPPPRRERGTEAGDRWLRHRATGAGSMSTARRRRGGRPGRRRLHGSAPGPGRSVGRPGRPGPARERHPLHARA